MIRRAALILCLALAVARAEPAAWAVKDARFRVSIRLKEAALFPDAGVAIEVPEFGQTRPDLGDVALVGADGRLVPIAFLWRGAGDRILLLAKALAAGEEYFLYFGGNRQASPAWQPTVSLLLETRRLPPGVGFDSWPMLEEGWRHGRDADGVGFTQAIKHGSNPFGESLGFMSHYSGYLHTAGLKRLFLYTLSSDASFVLVDETFAFGWPGRHSPDANAETVRGKDVPCPNDWTKIDYYQAKDGDGNPPAMVLGWRRDGKLEAIPSREWMHPGTTSAGTIEEARGLPVPLVSVKVHSYIGYGGHWYFDTECSLPPGQTGQWAFDDGATFSGASCRRVIPGPERRMVTVTLSRGNDGVRRITFPNDVRMANVNDPADPAWYVGLLRNETPSPVSPCLERDFLFLRDFGDAETAGRFAGAWLRENISPKKPLWIDAETAWLRYVAESDPRRALAELHGLSPETQRDCAAWLDPLEMEALVFNGGSPERIRQISLKNIGTPLERIADIRLGDLERLAGDYDKAAAHYLALQMKEEIRKLPAEDRAYSMTISGMLESGDRGAAERKLGEWEFRHPSAKLDTDFLLLRARTLILFGRWKEALQELDSFEKMQADSPYEIDAEFYRARVLFETGRKPEARKIWTDLAKNYPRNGLAGASREWAAKP